MDDIVDLNKPTLFEELVAPGHDRRQVASVMIASCLVTMIFLGIVDAGFKNELAPLGIVSFELAMTPAHGMAICSSWTQRQKLLVAFSLGADFLFMPVYATTICFCCIWSARVANKKSMTQSGIILGHAQYVAAICDVIENVALQIGLLNCKLPNIGIVFPIASTFAIIKFIIVLLGIGYCVGIGIDYQQHHKKRRTSKSD